MKKLLFTFIGLTISGFLSTIGYGLFMIWNDAPIFSDEFELILIIWGTIVIATATFLGVTFVTAVTGIFLNKW